ncbi:hypothetical protein B0J17DRAFT_654448 [Rhizoctonia solani]|nr:hypothetical protein B0J17DRAFT_654448 [Rhizoctonia solani]
MLACLVPPFLLNLMGQQIRAQSILRHRPPTPGVFRAGLEEWVLTHPYRKTYFQARFSTYTEAIKCRRSSVAKWTCELGMLYQLEINYSPPPGLTEDYMLTSPIYTFDFTLSSGESNDSQRNIMKSYGTRRNRGPHRT